METCLLRKVFDNYCTVQSFSLLIAGTCQVRNFYFIYCISITESKASEKNQGWPCLFFYFLLIGKVPGFQPPAFLVTFSRSFARKCSLQTSIFCLQYLAKTRWTLQKTN